MGVGLICSNSFDMVAESTDDRGMTEAALDSEYIHPGKKERQWVFFFAFTVWLQYAAKK